MNIAPGTTVRNLPLTALAQGVKPFKVDPSRLEIPTKIGPPPPDLADRWAAARSARDRATQVAAAHERLAASQQSSEFYKHFTAYLKAAASEASADIKV